MYYIFNVDIVNQPLKIYTYIFGYICPPLPIKHLGNFYKIKICSKVVIWPTPFPQLSTQFQFSPRPGEFINHMDMKEGGQQKSTNSLNNVGRFSICNLRGLFPPSPHTHSFQLDILSCELNVLQVLQGYSVVQSKSHAL